MRVAREGGDVRAAYRAGAIAAAVVADALLGDPARWHPVAGFGRLASALERVTYRDSRVAGVVHTAALVGAPVALTVALGRRLPGAAAPMLLSVLTWVALGGTSLAREGGRMAELLAADDLPGARARLTHLCARDPRGLPAAELARATVESLAENTSDAAVAPLLWAAALGAPGVVAYRAVNTLDAMVGYRSARYGRFGWASARLDDAANLVPARVTAALTVLAAPVVGGAPRAARLAWRRDSAHHPSPNAGHCESAFAGALGRTLGGTNTYDGAPEARGRLGDGPAPGVTDVARAARLSRAVVLAATVLAVSLSWAGGAR